MKNRERLLRKALEICHRVNHQVITAVCDQLENLPQQASVEDRVRIAKTISQPDAGNAIKKLFDIWSADGPEIAPGNLAWALRAASGMDEYHRNQESVEIVWTGPSFYGSTLRRTDQVLLDLIQGAKASLIIVTFAAYDIPHIAKALHGAAQRKVDIIMILESSEASAGKLAFGALDALGATAGRFGQVYVWPLDKREKDDAGHYGSLHVKCAVADDSAALISSANLTGHALNLNMELGVLIRGGEIPHKIAGHMRAMMGAGILSPVNV